MKERGFSVVNVDSTVSLDHPRLQPYIERIREGIAEALEVESTFVSIKAKSGEGLDAVGERRAVRADAIVLLTNSGA